MRGGYTALLFWTIISTYLFLKGLQENRPAWWLSYGLSAALGMYTHLTMGFVIAGQFIAFFIQTILDKHRPGWRRWQGIWIGFTSAGLITLLLYAPVLGSISSAMSTTLTGVPKIWNSPLWTILEILKGLQLGFSQSLVVAGGLCLMMLGIVDYFRRNPVFLTIFLLPPIIGSLATIALGHPLWPRFFFFAVGFGALVVVRGAMTLTHLTVRLLRLPGKAEIWLSSLLSITLILASAWSARNVYGPKQDYIGALKYVNASQQPEDAVVVASLTIPPYQEYLKTGWQAVKSKDELNKIKQTSARTWLVLTFPDVLLASFPELGMSISTDFQLMSTFYGTVGDGQVYVYRYPPDEDQNDE